MLSVGTVAGELVNPPPTIVASPGVAGAVAGALDEGQWLNRHQIVTPCAPKYVLASAAVFPIS